MTSSRRFLLLCGLFVLVVSAPAVIQLILTDGYLYYRNGVDEGFKLQYGASIDSQGISRPGQYLVTGLHLLGLSGGYINMILDVALPIAFLLLVRAIGRRLGLTERAASGCAFLLTFAPLVFNSANPLVELLFRASVSIGSIRYLAVPDGMFLLVLRSPEPQFSFVLLGGAILAGLRWRSLLPVYATLPFLYPMIALPVTFITIGLTLHRLLGSARPARNAILSVVGAYVILSVGSGVMLALTASSATLQLLLPTHVPMLSMTSLVALAGWFGLRHRLEPEMRFCALLVALAPLAACNIQVIMGWQVAPIEVEVYAGSVCAALLCGCALFAQPSGGAVATRQLRVGRYLAVAAMMMLFVRVMAMNVREVYAAPLLSQEVLDALRTDAGRVVWSDGQRTRLLALVFAQQQPTALDYGQTYPERDPVAGFERYLSVRGAILEDRRAAAFTRVLAALDAGYTHENEELLSHTSGRAKRFWVNRNVPLEAARHSQRATDLIFLVDDATGRLVIDRR